MNGNAGMVDRRSSGTGPWVLGTGLVVSLLVHATVGYSVVARANASWMGTTPDTLEITDPPMSVPPEQVDLGIEESNTASINWLGVVDNPQEGRAEESAVEQAALTVQPGATAQLMPEMPRVFEQPPEPASQSAEPIPESEQIPDPESIVQQPAPSAPIEIPDVFQRPEPVLVEPVEVEPEPEPDKAPPGPSLVAEPNPKKPVEPKQPTAQPTAPAPEQPASAPSTPGMPGIEALKESVATKIRDANKDPVVYDKMHRPFVGHGLDITPKRPDIPWITRNSAMPKNPIVVIRFGRNGRVKSAAFLVSADGLRRYNTGREDVDSPLLDAIYQWRAKGKQLLELDPDDPDAAVEISMRILFSKPRYEKTDG